MSDPEPELHAVDLPMSITDTLRAEIMSAIWGEQWVMVVPGHEYCEVHGHAATLITSHGLPRPQVRALLVDVTATLARSAMDE